MCAEEVQRPTAVPQGQQAFAIVSDAAADADSQEEVAPPDPGGPRRQHEHFERHRRRQDGGNRDGEQPVLAEDRQGALGVALLHALAQERFAAAPCERVQHVAAEHGPDRGECGVPEKPLWVRRHQDDDQDVDDFRKGQEGGIEEREDEEPGASQRQGQPLDPLEQARHYAKCRLDALNRDTRFAILIATAAGLFGAAAAIHYAHLGLTLTHYDARAHLVVARRILDSLTPGWQQIGAVWLPLPHVINALPVQVDAWYRSGASAVAISVMSMVVASGSLAWLIIRTTGSIVAAITAAALMMLNPNVLYLQGTPMTEPLLFGLSLFSIAATASWLDSAPRGGDSDRRHVPTLASAALAAACLTRYEAWPITAAIVALAVAVLMRRGAPWRQAIRAGAWLSLWPVVAIVVFSMNSRWVIGSWFVPSNFFVPENVEAIGNPAEAWRQIDEGLRLLSGSALVYAGYGGAALLVWDFLRKKGARSLVLLLGLAAAAALPMYAYLQGHPFRIRYDLPLVIAAAALAAAGIATLHPWMRMPVAALLVIATVAQAPPFDDEAPLVRESQREINAMAGRRAISAYLRAHYDGRTIMMSMGSLAHYMHDLANEGFDIKHFLHEGNGEIWRFALLRPAGHAGWLVLEQYAEGGDALYHASTRPRWLEGFEKVAEGGGATLYRAAPVSLR